MGSTSPGPPSVPPPPPGGVPPPPPLYPSAYGRRAYTPPRFLQPLPLQQPYNAIPAARAPFVRNGMLVVVQLLAIVQGILGLVTGINIIRADVALNNLPSSFAVPGGVNDVFLTYGVAVLVISALVMFAGVRVGHPSQIARWLLAVWEIIGFLTILAALTGAGLAFGLLTVLTASAGGIGLVPVLVVLAIQALIVYGLAIHPATYEAFAR